MDKHSGVLGWDCTSLQHPLTLSHSTHLLGSNHAVKGASKTPSTWHFVSCGCVCQSSKATKGKTCCFQECIKAGSVGLDVCLISVLRWLYPSQEGWDGAAQVPPTEGVCSRSFCTKEYHYDFHRLTFSQPTEQKSSS